MAAACDKPAGTGRVAVSVAYSVNGGPLTTDSLCYRNEAGNTFMITEIQWFVSKMALQDERGEWHPLGTFYIDTDIPESQTTEAAPLPVGHYQTLRFTFGLDEEDNRSGLFADAPEADMFWPEPLGGGYHYMKLNGKYLNDEGRPAPLAIHLGIGQNDDLSEFYQNYFNVALPIDLNVAQDTESRLDLTMVVDNWFRSPNTIDFNEYGSHIMQNQAAQQALRENGGDVFIIGNENDTTMGKETKLTEGFNKTMKKAAPKASFWNWKSVKERLKGRKPASRHGEDRSNPEE